MKKVSQVIPKEQVEILVESLNVLEAALKTVDDKSENLNYKLFDILVLKALLNKTEVVVNVPFELYEKFTAENGVDFPNY
jgi:hypothetical protein